MSNTRSHVYHRNPNVTPPLARAGRNQFIIASEDVSRFPIVDLSCGAAVTGLGHSNRVVKDAIYDQIRELAYCHSAQFTAPVVEMAAAMILDEANKPDAPNVIGRDSNMPFDGGAVAFFSGGAEAVEAAVKMALQFQSHVKPDTGPAAIVGRRHSYHGNSMFTLALGDHPRKNVLSAGFNVTAHVERIEAFAPALFTPELEHDELRAHIALCLSSLEAVLQTNALQHRRCVVVIETVGGTTIGIAPPHTAYLVGVRELCDAFEAVLIYDEILCANFRTGRLTAWQYYQENAAYDIAPDIFVMGKGITAGYFPMSAVVVNRMIRESGESDGKVWHTSTNQNHVIGCAAACAAIAQYAKIVPTIEMHASFVHDQVMPFLKQAEGVHSVSGVGMLWGVHFDPTIAGLHQRVKKVLFARGYSVYSDGATVEGRGNMIMFAPPYVMGKDDLMAAARAITMAVVDARS